MDINCADCLDHNNFDHCPVCERVKRGMMLDRPGDWKRFSEQIVKHIDLYTIPQYQDENAEKDQVGAWTSKECIDSMQRYINRFGKNARGSKEALRDMLKLAHYAQLAYDKLKAELGEGDVY